MATIYTRADGRQVYDNGGVTYDAKTAESLGNAPAATTPPPLSAPAAAVPTQTPEQLKQVFADSGQKPVVTPTPSASPITTSDMTRGTQLPDASTYASTNAKAPLSDAVTKVASATLDATGKAIDSLQAQREAEQKAAKDIAQTNVNTDTAAIADLGKKEATANQDTLAATRSKFNTDQMISDLTTIQTKIASAQEALNMGLIYETDRPAREQLILGRSASLQKQGLATIGALQATAQILQGNLDLAESYAKTTISAINTDNKNAMDALTTLLSLHSDNLVQLSADEKSTLDSRIKALQDQDKSLQDNSDQVFKLMSDYPGAALQGGVTLLDDRATALKKMLPRMSADEKLKFDASIAKNTTTDKDGPANDKTQLLAFKANGMTYPEALNAFSDTLSVDWINSVYRQPNTPGGAADTVKDAAYSSYLDASGNLKAGYVSTVDPVHPGAPTVTVAKGYHLDSTTGNPVKDTTGGFSLWNPSTWW